jgi:hypothetical protein
MRDVLRRLSLALPPIIVAEKTRVSVRIPVIKGNKINPIPDKSLKRAFKVFSVIVSPSFAINVVVRAIMALATLYSRLWLGEVFFSLFLCAAFMRQKLLPNSIFYYDNIQKD